ncbi:MAG TPA: J domain-containing protein [Polyangiaceae bacterium]
MNLPGRLKLATLGDLLGTLHRAEASGVLELVEGRGPSAGRSHRIYLARGFVDGVETELDRARIGELLHERGLIDRTALATLLRCVLEQPGRRAGEILVGERLANPAIVGALLRVQLKERLDAMFGLSDASVRFHVRRAKAPAPSGLLLSPRDFLYGRPRTRSRASAETRARVAALDDTGRANAYRTLGLEPGADAASVRQAFRRLAREHHPDCHPHAGPRELATLVQRLSQITAAYHRIGI